MKRYKIGNKIITADSATQAVKIAKLLDDKATYERRKEAVENFSMNKRVLGNILDLVKHDKDLTDEERRKLTMTINSYLSDLERMSDSVKDEASPIDTVNSLVQEELSAIDSYNVAIKNLEGKIPEESLAAIKAIRDDEQTHVQNLYAVINGNVTAKNLEN